MSKDAAKRVVLTADAKQKFDECVAAMAACGFGADGPPINTTFAEIEDFGHEVAQLVACAIDERLTQQHAGVGKVNAQRGAQSGLSLGGGQPARCR